MTINKSNDVKDFLITDNLVIMWSKRKFAIAKDRYMIYFLYRYKPQNSRWLVVDRMYLNDESEKEVLSIVRSCGQLKFSTYKNLLSRLGGY